MLPPPPLLHPHSHPHPHPAGFLVDFISFPVISGFTSAAAITIGFGQVKHLFGLNGIRRPFIQCVHDTFSKLGDTHPPDLILGIASIVILVGLKMLKTHYGEGTTWKHKTIWLLSTARNAVVVILAGIFAYGIVENNQLAPCDKGDFKRECLTIILDLPSGMPNIAAPSLKKEYFSVRFWGRGESNGHVWRAGPCTGRTTATYGQKSPVCAVVSQPPL